MTKQIIAVHIQAIMFDADGFRIIREKWLPITIPYPGNIPRQIDAYIAHNHPGTHRVNYKFTGTTIY
jgi:hypothetical protein